MLKLFKTLIILYSTVATVSATVTLGDPTSIPFNPLTYGTDGDPASNYDVIVPKQTGTTIVEQGVNSIEVPVYQKQLQQAQITIIPNPEQSWVTKDVPVYTNSTGDVFNTEYGTNSCTYKIFVQQYGSTTTYSKSNYEYSSDGMPVVTKALKSNFVTPYQINEQDVFRQKMTNDIELQFNNDPDKTPVLSSGGVKTNGNLTCYADSDGNIYVVNGSSQYTKYDQNGTLISGEENIPINNYQQDTNTTINGTSVSMIRKQILKNNASYNILYYNNGIPKITKVLYSNGTDYLESSTKIYRAKYEQEDSFVFDANGNPVFIEGDKITPYFKKDDTYTEVDDTKFDVGQLIKVTNNNGTTEIQACVDKKIDSIKWYDLKTYIAIHPDNGSGVQVSENTNFIVKDDFTLQNSVVSTNFNMKLFIPENITLTIGLNNSIEAFKFGNESYTLIRGKIYNEVQNITSVFSFSSSAEATIVMAPTGEIYNKVSTTQGFFNGSSHFIKCIIYPGFTFNDVLTSSELQEGNYYSNNTLELYRISIGTTGVLYLNRFLESNTAVAKNIKVIVQNEMDIVFPKSLEGQKNNLIKQATTTNYDYIDLFPNLLWNGHGDHNQGTKLPMSYEDMNNSDIYKKKYFFEEVYSGKNYYVGSDNKEVSCEVNFVADSIGRNILSLIVPENAKLRTFDDPFLAEDTAFGYIDPNNPKTIDRIISSVQYNSSLHNPESATNKYWNTGTIDTLFVDSNNNPYMLSNDIPAILNVGLIGDKNVSTNATTITLNGDNQYYTGTYTVPASTTVNLNHENALVSINKLKDDGNGVKRRQIVYKDVKKDVPTDGKDIDNNSFSSDSPFTFNNEKLYIDDLSGLTYNIETNINWDVSKTKNLLYNTGEKITEATGTNKTNLNMQNTTGKTLTTYAIDTDKKGIVLDMQLVGSDKFITFTNSNNVLVVDTITFNRTNSSANSLQYFIPSPEMNTVIFESENSIVKIPYNLNLIFTNGDTVFIEETSFVGVLLKKVKYGANKNITTIIYYNGGNKEKYTRVTGNSWKKDNGNSEEPSTSGFMSSFFCNIGEAEKEEDNRDTIDKMRDPGYKYNNSRAIDGFYLNTTKNGYYNDIIGGTDGENQKKYDINQLYHNSENINANDGLQNKMPPILNIGLVNNGNLTIENVDNNKKVEINGINYGIRDCCSMNLLYWNAYDNSYYNGCTQEVDDNNKKPIGKPYTGELTVPNEIKDIEFGTFSFIPLIKIDDNNSNNPDKPAFTGNYTFKGYNIVQYYNTGGNIEAKNDNLLFPIEKPYYDYSTNELTLNLNKVTVNKGVTVILNNAHISVKAPTP